MATKLLSLLVLLLATVRIVPAAGIVSGKVTGRPQGEPLPGVNVLVRGTVRGTTTNTQGEFRIADIPSGTYTLLFSSVGYQREVRSGVPVTEGKETIVNVSLVQTAVQAEQIVVTASKREESLEDVPVSISVMDAGQIRLRNSVSIDEALRYIPGVNITGTQINIRGSSGYSLGAGSRVLMLLDGVPFLAGDTGELNFESVPMGMVDRIEVVKGASSALYGSNALGGVVNIITKPIPEGAATDLRTYGGIYSDFPAGQWKWSDKLRSFNGQSILHTHRSGDLGLALFFSRQADDSYRMNDYTHRYNFFLKSREEFSPTSSFTLDFGLAWQDKGQFLFWRNIDSALIPPANHSNDNMVSTRYYFNGTYNDALSERLLFSIKALWYHNNWGYESQGDVARTESRADEYRLEALTTVLLGDQHTLTAGVDGNIDLIGGDIFGDRHIGGLALYGQDEIRLTPALTLTLGARFDFQTVGLTGEAGQLNPKVGLTCTPVEGTTLRASFGQGFRVPSLPEAFVAAGTTSLQAIPNTGLKPEKSWSYEVGVSQHLGDALLWDLAGFRSDFSNLIEPGLLVTGGNLALQWRNVTKARIQGFETSLKLGLFDGGLVGGLGYTYVYPQDLTLHDILKYRPRHVLYTSTTGRIGWLSLTADFRFVSRMERIDQELVDTGVIPDGDQRVPIYVWDFRLGGDLALLGVPLTATFSVNNAFQHRYVELIGNIMPPRNYVLVLETHL